jgi:carbon-monoxide dehydrogenase medium subunit
MTLWKNYLLPETVEDALQLLSAAPAPSRLVAGGTDLLLDLQQGRHAPVATLIDVTSIAEMCALEIRDGRLFVGAARPLNQVVADPLVAWHVQALQEAAGLIGGPQVRNTATLGGNVAHALPAADGAIALLALDALAEVAGPNGRRFALLDELYLGPGRSVLAEQGELLVGFHLPLRQPGQASAFRRVMRPQGVAIAILNTAVWLERQGDVLADVRLAVGPAGPRPFRLRQAETVLRGSRLSAAVLDNARQTLLGEVRFRTSPHRATAEYRRHLSGVLLEETLTTAWERSFNR